MLYFARFRRPQLSALGLWLGAMLALMPWGPAAAAEFTPEQRQAIEAIVRDFLQKNPEALLDALQAAEDKIKGDAHDKAAAALVARRYEVFDDPDAPVAGNPKGNASLVEFFDYRCPYCKQVEPSLEALLREDRQLRIIYKELPILGKDSVYATRVALAARKQAKYEAFHAAMMAAKGQIDEKVVVQVAASAGLDMEQVKTDMKSAEVDDIIQRNLDLAQALDIRGTPAFIIGSEMVPGAIDIATMKKKIAAARKAG
jgi:protein-disulfide isomerase